MLCQLRSIDTMMEENDTDFHMDFTDESMRIGSFRNWPFGAPVSPTALSRAGFFYTGDGRMVQCAYCHILIGDWSYGDQAILKHRERKPDCPFVLNAYSEPRRRESERRKTFTGWPVPFISAEDLARAGFVYLKTEDRVQCVFCEGVVGSWEQGDIPWNEHKRHFKRCPFVRGLDVGNISIEDEYRGPQTSSSPSSSSSSSGSGGGIDVVGHHRRVTASATAASSSVGSHSESPSNGTGMTNGELNINSHSPAKNPTFNTRESRLRTFMNWSSDMRQSPKSMAEAGFFYTGQLDHVKCFHCNGGLRNWEPNDDPWEEHARWFPNCEFISLNKGSEYVASAREHKPTIIEPQLVSGLEAKPSNQSTLITESEIDHLMETELARQALTSLQLEPTKMRMAFRKRMQEAGYPFSDVESLVNAVLDLDNTNEATEEGKGFRDDQTQPVIAIRGGSSSTTNGTNGQSSKMDEMDPRICKICWDKEVCVVFLPCGHLASCAECASALKDCPFCRQQIKGTVKTYWP